MLHNYQNSKKGICQAQNYETKICYNKNLCDDVYRDFYMFTCLRRTWWVYIWLPSKSIKKCKGLIL